MNVYAYAANNYCVVLILIFAVVPCIVGIGSLL